MEAFLALAVLIACDDRPTTADRSRLPSVAVCQCQIDAATEWVRALEYAEGLSPCRAHLLAPELAEARQYRDWWMMARTVAQEPFQPHEDRCRMACLRAQLGAGEWFCGAWPKVVP